MKTLADQVRDALRQAARGKPRTQHTLLHLAYIIDDETAEHLRRLLR